MDVEPDTKDLDPKLTTTISSSSSDDEDDPVTATYPVFLNPSLPLGRRLLVLQQPNRVDEFPRPPPSELRIKANAGMVEIDMPLDHAQDYDREKGLKWGRTLQASMLAKNGGSHGLAGGFGFGTVQRGGGGRKKAEEDEDVLDWSEAVRQDKVLRIQTLGGQYPEYKEVQYMVGVFQGKDLHLTPVSSLVHLRPQLHHIDATTQQERQSAAGSKEGTSTGGAAGAARAIHMTVKTTADGDSVTTETMADRLRAVQTEHWRKMRYTDENEEAAWEVYNESLFLQPAQQDGEGAEEKQPEDDRPLEDAVPRFGVRWDDKQLLEAVSGIRKPEPEPPAVKEVAKAKQPQIPVQPAPAVEAARQPKLRPRGGGTTMARRGGKVRAPSKTVDID